MVARNDGHEEVGWMVFRWDYCENKRGNVLPFLFRVSLSSIFRLGMSAICPINKAWLTGEIAEIANPLVDKRYKVRRLRRIIFPTTGSWLRSLKT
jgi:hypothetical protein